jgi:hypothetical protein
VDEEIEKVWIPLINCTPPWLSSKDQCDSLDFDITEDFVDKTLGMIDRIYNMITYPTTEKCKIPCTVAHNIVYGKKVAYDPNSKRIILSIKFEDKVVYTTKKLAYGPFEFLIDMGSSLGLWFGLSVFGITDLGIAAFHWAKSNRQEVMRKFIN